MITNEQVIEVAKQCFDSELPVNIWDLGLIYEIMIDPDDRIKIKMTLTSPSHQATTKMPTELKKKIVDVLHPKDIQIELVFEPLWNPDRMTDDGKKKLGIED